MPSYLPHGFFLTGSLGFMDNAAAFFGHRAACNEGRVVVGSDAATATLPCPLDSCTLSSCNLAFVSGLVADFRLLFLARASSGFLSPGFASGLVADFKREVLASASFGFLSPVLGPAFASGLASGLTSGLEPPVASFLGPDHVLVADPLF